MELNLAADLAELAKRGFPSQKKQIRLLQDIHSLLANPDFAYAHDTLYLMRTWLLKACTFWVQDLVGMANYICDVVRSRGQLDEKLLAVLREMRRMPPQAVHDTIAKVEEAMAVGDYDWCLTDSAQGKFQAATKIKLADPKLHADFAELDRLHGVDQYRNPAGIVRRRFRMERNFLPMEMRFKWGTDKDKFQVAFDLFCDNHSLHGYEGPTALLQKLAVYPTHRSVVFDMPRYWSLDQRRDLNWKAINALLRAWDMPRQGEKMSFTRAERTEQKQLARKYAAEAKTLGITGPARIEYITAKLGLQYGTDARVIRRLLE